MASDLLKTIQIKALQSVIQPDSAAFLRSVHRWYSESFNTPLHVVYALPVDFVLTHYFESNYSSMEHEERAKTVRDLLETPEQRAKRLKDEDSEIATQMEIIAAKLKPKASLKEIVSNAKDGAEISKAIETAFEGVPESLPSPLKAVESAPLVEKAVPPPEFEDFSISGEGLDEDSLSIPKSNL